MNTAFQSETGDKTRRPSSDRRGGGDPKSNRLHPWKYDQEMYRRRYEIERLFRRLKGFLRIFSRFDKLDVMFTAFIHFALIADALLSVNTP